MCKPPTFLAWCKKRTDGMGFANPSQGTSGNTCWIAAETLNEIWTEIALRAMHRKLVAPPDWVIEASSSFHIKDILSSQLLDSCGEWYHHADSAILPLLPFRAIRPRALKGHLDKYLGSNNISSFTLVLRIDGWVCRYAYLMSSVQNLLLTWAYLFTVCNLFQGLSR